MEELEIIQTNSGRQFEPWVSASTLQAIVQDEDSVTALASEIASAKATIAEAINTKGGESSATESFVELAEDINQLPTSGVLSDGIVQSEPFSFMDYVCKQGAYPFTEINDNSVTTINRPNAFYQQTALLNVTMSALETISGSSVFQGCSALQSVTMPNVSIISGSSVFRDCVALKTIYIPNFTSVGGNGGELAYIYNLETLTVGKLTGLWSSTLNGSGANLRNITIGQDTDINLPFDRWGAQGVIAEGQSGIDELNANLYDNLLTKLYDHTNDGETRTLRIGWLANVSADNITYANAKGWTLTT